MLWTYICYFLYSYGSQFLYPRPRVWVVCENARILHIFTELFFIFLYGLKMFAFGVRFVFDFCWGWSIWLKKKLTRILIRFAWNSNWLWNFLQQKSYKIDLLIVKHVVLLQFSHIIYIHFHLQLTPSKNFLLQS